MLMLYVDVLDITYLKNNNSYKAETLHCGSSYDTDLNLIRVGFKTFKWFFSKT